MKKNDGDSEGDLRSRSRRTLKIIKYKSGLGCFGGDHSTGSNNESSTGHLREKARRYQQEMHVIETHFCPALIEWARRRSVAMFYWPETSTSRLVHEQAADLSLVPDDVRYRVPKSVEDLFSAISPVFNACKTARLVANVASFDVIAGVECTEDFLGQKFNWDWVVQIIEKVFRAAEAVDESSYLASSVASVPGSQRGTDRKGRPRPDEPGDTCDIVRQTHKIIQINLRGTSLTEAWAADPVTGSMSQNLQPGWTPETPGSNFVYHGTTAHYNANGRTGLFKRDPFDALALLSTASQMGFKTVPATFTAFSPERAFLWAAFKNIMACTAPSTKPLGYMQQSWVCDGAIYLGIVLFQYRITQPSPPGLTHYTIPAGSERAWGEISQVSAAYCTPQMSVWERYDAIHGKGKGRWPWPNIVHSLEYSKQGEFSPTSRTNMWRTLWTGDEGGAYLNSQHAATFAVNFEFISPGIPPHPVSKTPKSGNDGGQEKREGTKEMRWTQKLKKKALSWLAAIKLSS